MAHLQKEMCPRISANDLTDLLRSKPDELLCLDIRSTSDYTRVHLPNSLNIPYNTLHLDEKSLESLNAPQLEEKIKNRIIVCISNIHENAVEVSKMLNYIDYNLGDLFICSLQFSKFLVECGIPRVCILHQGFNILHSIEPNILASN